MALKPCRECGAQVSTEAEICPHCGVRSPTVTNPLSDSGSKTRGGLHGPLGVVLLAVIVITLWAFDKTKGPQTPQISDQISDCRSDWTKCADNEQLVKNYSRWSDVQSECKTQANKQARYGTPVWPFLSEFATFRTGNGYVTSGTAVTIEPDAEFQNGFGAMVVCTENLNPDVMVMEAAQDRR